MNNWIKMFYTVSSKGNPMYTNAPSIATDFGRLFQGSKPGQEASAPWFLVIKDVDPDSLPREIYANTESGAIKTVDEYDALQDSATA